MRILTLVLFFVALILLAPASADGSIDAVMKQLKANESYSFKLQGHDDNGKYSAIYLYSPDLQIWQRQDQNGTSTYLYDKLKRPDKVMVTRNGVAYMYSLDNPLLPDHFPGSLLESYLQDRSRVSATTAAEGAFPTLVISPKTGASVTISELVFSPDLDDPTFSRMARFLRGR